MIQRLFPLAGRLNKNREIFFGLFLSNIFPKGLWEPS